MTTREFRPGEKIEVLANRYSIKDPNWMDAEIDDILSTQVTYNCKGTTGFVFKSDFNDTWRMAGEK